MKLLKKIRWALFPKEEELVNTLQNTWDNFGEHDPFYSVITYEKYKDKHLTDELIDEFYSNPNAEGCTLYVERKLKELKQHGLESFKHKTGLDFGCGVGRNIVHLAPHFKKMVGLDISAKHLDYARKACKKRNLDNVIFFKSNQDIEPFGKFDFIFTVITLQHIPPPLMKKYIEQLLNMLNHNGIAFIHLPVDRAGYKYNEEKCIQQGKVLSWQMHLLPIQQMNRIINRSNCTLLEFDNTADHCGKDWENGFFIIEKK